MKSSGNFVGAAAEFPAELRKIATSLRIEAGRLFSRPELAAAILRELDADYARIRAGQFTAIADEWEAACTTIGKNVSVQGCVSTTRTLRGILDMRRSSYDSLDKAKQNSMTSLTQAH